MSEEQYLPVHVLMARALTGLPPIGKDSVAPAGMGGYQFRGIEDITAALKPVLSEHGLFCLPTTTERIATERRVGNNKIMYCIDVHVGFKFYGPNGDSVSASVWGQGTDMGDKATQKAYTSAFKSMLTIAFLIADEQNDAERHDVPDSDEPPPPPPKRTDDEIAKEQGWESDDEKQQVLAAVAPGLRKLVDEGEISEEVGKGLWLGVPGRDGKKINMTKAQFDSWIEGVEAAKVEHAAAKQAQEAFGAEEVPTQETA